MSSCSISNPFLIFYSSSQQVNQVTSQQAKQHRWHTQGNFTKAKTTGPDLQEEIVKWWMKILGRKFRYNVKKIELLNDSSRRRLIEPKGLGEANESNYEGYKKDQK